MTTCPQCRGAIGEAGKAYGYAGPWCACLKVTRANPDHYMWAIKDAHDKELSELRAQLEQVTKERDEARAENKESIRLYVICNRRANYAEVRAADAEKQRDSARAQRDRLMRVVEADVLPMCASNCDACEYGCQLAKFVQEIAKEKEVQG